MCVCAYGCDVCVMCVSVRVYECGVHVVLVRFACVCGVHVCVGACVHVVLVRCFFVCVCVVCMCMWVLMCVCGVHVGVDVCVCGVHVCVRECGFVWVWCAYGCWCVYRGDVFLPPSQT